VRLGVPLHLGREELQGNTSVEGGVLGQEHLAHAAPADLLEDAVPAKGLPDHVPHPSEGILIRDAPTVNGPVEIRSHYWALCPDFIATVAAGNRESPSQFVSKLCPKIIRNIEMYLKISKSIEILESLKTRILLRISIIICNLAFSAASYTR
jgi:hypothetical protein